MWGGFALLIVVQMLIQHGPGRIVGDFFLRWTMMIALLYNGLLPIIAGGFVIARKAFGWWLMMVLSLTGVYFWWQLAARAKLGGHPSAPFLFFIFLDVASIVILAIIRSPRHRTS